MKLSDVQPRLVAPFSAHVVEWKPGVITKDKKRALMLAYVDARAVMDRLDAIAPDAWEYSAEVIHGAPVPTVKGALTILGVTREDFGEGDPTTDAGRSYKAATSDALKRCAVHFGIGRYLYDLPRQWAEWDDVKRVPSRAPTLPDWALPDHERSPGGAHIVQAMEQLKYELPADLDRQREVYKHLKAAVASLDAPGQPTAQAKAGRRDPEPALETSAATAQQERPDEATATPSRPAQRPARSKPLADVEVLAAHAKRAGAKTTAQRAVLWAHLLKLTDPIETHDLSGDQGDYLLSLLSGWNSDRVSAEYTKAVADFAT